MWWMWLGAATAIVISAVSAYCKLSSGRCRCERQLVGLTALVTGGSSGIGFFTALDLARRGARLIIASRNQSRGVDAQHKIITSTGNKNVTFLQLDLESLSSVRLFVQTILETESRLDILVNNAGVLGTDSEKTKDGLHPTMQTNHFGPFLLTYLLLPLLKSCAPSRIVTVSSMLYRFGKIDFENLNMEKRSRGMMAVYKSSKLANVLMTLELSRRLRGTGVMANCLHPGMVITDIHPAARSMTGWKKQLIMRLARLFCKTSEEGAQTSIFLAVSPDVASVSGGYYSDCRRKEIAAPAMDVDTGRRLWEVSEKLVGLSADSKV